jgi:hypothetical protein
MQISIAVPRTVADARILVETTQFRQMDQTDFEGFCGVEDENALIGEFGDYGTIIIERDRIAFIDHDEGHEVHLIGDEIIEIL